MIGGSIRRLGRLGVFAAVLAVAIASVATPSVAQSTPAPPASGAPETPPAAPAILDLVGCIQGSSHLTVEMLIDESASLKVTDPKDQRVTAAQAALDGLLALTTGKGSGQPKVDVALSAFSNEYRQIRPWTSVTEANAPELRRDIGALRTRNRGTDTDFINALTGARESLADQSAAVTAEGDDAPCKAILLFTDGQYDIAVRSTKAQRERLGTTKPYAPGIVLDDEASVRRVEAKGRDELCRKDGLADGLRNDDIRLLTVALSGSVPPSQQRLLAAASAGTADGVTCGTPTDIPPGAYLPAGQVDLLVSRFDEIAARLAGGTLLPSAAVTLCDDEVCDEGSRTVPVDLSVRQVHLFALAPEPGMVVEVSGPAGAATITKAGTIAIGGTTARVRAISTRGWSIDIDRPDPPTAWVGAWTFSVVDTSGKQVGKDALLEVYVFSDIGVALDDFGRFERGKSAAVTARLVVPKGVDANKQVRSAEAVLRLDDPVTGASVRVPLEGPVTGPYLGSFTPPADFTSSAYDALVELRAVTNDGAEIVTRSAPRSVLVRRPGDSIQVAPAELAMPSLTGDGSTSADLILVGGSKPGCAWFPRTVMRGPEDAGSFSVSFGGKSASTRATCIKVPANDSKTVTVEVTPSGRATGSVRGVIEFNEVVDGNPETVTRLPVDFDMARGVDETQRLVLAFGLLLAGLLLPVLLLMVINAISARFQSLDVVQGAVIPVIASGTRLFRGDPTTGNRPFHLAASDFAPLAGRGGPRRFTFGGVVFSARASANPFGPGRALAAPEGGGEKLKGGAGAKVELDLALAGSWVFLLDPDRTRELGGDNVGGDLILFLAEGETRAQLARVTPDILARLPKTAARLAGLLRRKPAKYAKASKASKAARPAEPVRGREAPADAAPPGIDGVPRPVADADVFDVPEDPGGPEA